MTVFEFLNPLTFWQILKKVFINVKNWNYYLKQMRELQNNGTLRQMGMRLDMRGRAYYVLNLEPETLMMGTEVLELERSRVVESINLRKGVFEKADLLELIEVETTRIKNLDYYAYLIQIKYRSSSSAMNWVYLFSWMAITSLAAYYVVSNWSYAVHLAKEVISQMN